MSTSEESYSHKRIALSLVDSNVYRDIPPEMRDYLAKKREVVGDDLAFPYSPCPHYPLERVTALCNSLNLDESQVNVYMKAWTLDITTLEAISLIDRAQEILLNTEEGMSLKVDQFFGDSKHKRFRGPAPGTIRVFSNELMSVWTGKNWIRLKRTGVVQ